jgi:branched-chain amino acid transport system permease protein
MSSQERRAISAFVVIAALLYLFLYIAVPEFDSDKREFVRWLLPEAAINEALIWVVATIGVHISVDRFGLVDLGAAAFWAIGGYLAALLMSPFWDGGNIRFLTVAPSWTRGIHLSFWLVLIVIGAVCALVGATLAIVTAKHGWLVFAVSTLFFALLMPRVLGRLVPAIGAIDPIGVAGRAITAYDLQSRFLIYGTLLLFVIVVALRINQKSPPRGAVAGYALAAAVGGVAGALMVSHSNTVTQAQFGVNGLVLVLSVVLIARGSIWWLVFAGVLSSWIYSTGLQHLREGLAYATNASIDSESLRWTFLILLLSAGLLSRGLAARRRSQQTGNA